MLCSFSRAHQGEGALLGRTVHRLHGPGDGVAQGGVRPSQLVQGALLGGDFACRLGQTACHAAAVQQVRRGVVIVACKHVTALHRCGDVHVANQLKQAAVPQLIVGHLGTVRQDGVQPAHLPGHLRLPGLEHAP